MGLEVLRGHFSMIKKDPGWGLFLAVIFKITPIEGKQQVEKIA